MKSFFFIAESEQKLFIATDKGGPYDVNDKVKFTCQAWGGAEVTMSISHLSKFLDPNAEEISEDLVYAKMFSFVMTFYCFFQGHRHKQC